MVDMDSDLRPSPVPRPRVFPVVGTAPGPRCGHTLTAISGPEGDLSKAKLVLFGEHILVSVFMEQGRFRTWAESQSVSSPALPAGGATALEGSSGKSESTQSTPGSAASGMQVYARANGCIVRCPVACLKGRHLHRHSPGRRHQRCAHFRRAHRQMGENYACGGAPFAACSSCGSCGGQYGGHSGAQAVPVLVSGTSGVV